jgi:hypothetical protein
LTIVENCEIYEDEEELEKAIEYDEPADTYVAFNEAKSDNCSYTIVCIHTDKTFVSVAEVETQDEVTDVLTDLNNF